MASITYANKSVGGAGDTGLWKADDANNIKSVVNQKADITTVTALTSIVTSNQTKLSTIEENATADMTAGEIEAIVNHDNLQGFIANEHIDWTVDQGANNIHKNNISEVDAGTLLSGTIPAGRINNTSISGIAVPTTRNVNTGTGLSGGGALSSDLTLSLAVVGSITPGSYNNANVTVDAYGRVTGITTGAGGGTFSNLTLSGDTGSNQTIVDADTITISGGTGMATVAGATDTITINLSHLGLESLTDPNADRLMFWDDSAGSLAWLTLGSNLTLTGTTLSATSGGSTPSTGIIDEDGNSTNTISFSGPSKYINCTGTIELDFTNASSYQNVQILEHVSSNDLVLPSEVRRVSGTYTKDGSTVNLIYIHKVDGENVVDVNINPERSTVDASNLVVSGSGLDEEWSVGYASISNESNSLYYFKRADDSGMSTNVQYWNGSSWGGTETGITSNGYTPTSANGDSNKYIQIGVRAGVLSNNIVLYSQTIVYSTSKQVGAAPSITRITAENNFTFSGDNVASPNLVIDTGGLGTPKKESNSEAFGTDSILLFDRGDKVKFVFNAPAGAGTYSKLRVYFRSGTGASQSAYEGANLTMELTTTGGTITLSNTKDPAASYDFTSSFGSSYWTFTTNNNVTLDATGNELSFVHSTIDYAGVDHIEITQ